MKESQQTKPAPHSMQMASKIQNWLVPCKSVLSLPIEPLQKEEVTAQVIEAVREAVKNPQTSGGK